MTETNVTANRGNQALNELSSILHQLTNAWKIHPKVANDIIAKYDTSYIKQKMDFATHKVKSGVYNPSGFLVRAIKDDWGFLAPKKQGNAQKAQFIISSTKQQMWKESLELILRVVGADHFVS